MPGPYGQPHGGEAAGGPAPQHPGAYGPGPSPYGQPGPYGASAQPGPYGASAQPGPYGGIPTQPSTPYPPQTSLRGAPPGSCGTLPYGPPSLPAYTPSPSRSNPALVVILVAVAALSLLAAAGAFVLLRTNGSLPGSRAGDSTPPHANADRSGILLGSSSSPRTVTLYTDYQCPPCGRFNAAFFRALREGAEQGRYQLEIKAVTFVEKSLGNDSSTRAAVAAACADTVGHYADMHDTIFQNQPAREGDGFGSTQLRQDFPASAGIGGTDLTAFQKCYDQRSTLPFVTMVAGKATGISSTPTLRVDGQDVTGRLNLNDPASLDSVLPR